MLSPNVVFSSCHCCFPPKYIPHCILILPLPQGQAPKIVLIFTQYSSFSSTNQPSSTHFHKKFRTHPPPSKTNSAATAVAFSPNFRVGRQPAFVSAASDETRKGEVRYGRGAEAKPQGERGHILLQEHRRRDSSLPQLSCSAAQRPCIPPAPPAQEYSALSSHFASPTGPKNISLILSYIFVALTATKIGQIQNSILNLSCTMTRRAHFTRPLRRLTRLRQLLCFHQFFVSGVSPLSCLRQVTKPVRVK